MNESYVTRSSLGIYLGVGVSKKLPKTEENLRLRKKGILIKKSVYHIKVDICTLNILLSECNKLKKISGSEKKVFL